MGPIKCTVVQHMLRHGSPCLITTPSIRIEEVLVLVKAFLYNFVHDEACVDQQWWTLTSMQCSTTGLFGVFHLNKLYIVHNNVFR
jgi:hypothetical protein